MDYRERARLNQDKSIRIKHMAFAVKSVDEALVNYQSLLSVSEKTEKVIWEKAETKVAIFYINDIEYQLCESLNKNGRFTEWIEKYGEGLHHICYEVDNIDNYLKISFETKNLQESFSISDKIAFMLEKDFSKVAYSKNENGSFTEIFIINP